MKKYIFLLTSFILISCNDQFLNIDSKTELTSTVIFSDKALAEKAVLGVYRGLWWVDGWENFNVANNSCLTDETILNVLVWNWAQNYWEGKWSADYTDALDDRKKLHQWEWNYQWIRQSNLMIQQLEASTELENDLKNKLLGESYFLRAIYHYYTWIHYGGIPIVDQTFNASDDLSNFGRKSFAETVEFMVKDLDKSFELLKDKSIQKGRASAGAALAIKSRILTYAASDLYEPTKNKVSIHQNYANKELIMYSGTLPDAANSQQKRWQRAKDASLAALNYNSSFSYSLGNSSPLALETAYNTYNDLYKSGSSQETIFERVLDKSYDTDPLGWDAITSNWFYAPGGYGYANGLSANAPLGEFADDFQYAKDTNSDGIIDFVEDFSWANQIHKNDPFKFRDPRMEATIGIENGRWLGQRYYEWQRVNNPYLRTVDNSSTGRMQFGEYEVPANGDKPAGLTVGLDNTIVCCGFKVQAGYSHKKHLSYTSNPNLGAFATWWTSLPQPIIRYTELVLNYAEACIALGDENTAKSYLNKIRFRAGMPGITETGAALLNRYRNERRLELSFEGHRYYDVRRWITGPKLTATGVKIKGSLKDPNGETFKYYNGYDESKYSYSYSTAPVNYYPTRIWSEKNYFRPIRTSILQKQTNLIQNPGY